VFSSCFRGFNPELSKDNHRDIEQNAEKKQRRFLIYSADIFIETFLLSVFRMVCTLRGGEFLKTVIFIKPFI
jgi:hypothetical protein